MRPIYAALKNFKSPWVLPRLLFPKFFMGFCSDQTFECAYKIHSWDNKGYSRNWAVLRPRSIFSKIFNGLLFGIRMDPLNVLAEFEICSFNHSWDKSELIFRVANTQSWGTGGRKGRGVGTVQRALVTSYRLSIVTFPLSSRVSEILPLLCSSMPLFPTPL